MTQLRVEDQTSEFQEWIAEKDLDSRDLPPLGWGEAVDLLGEAAAKAEKNMKTGDSSGE